jgi:hypothetical protein
MVESSFTVTPRSLRFQQTGQQRTPDQIIGYRPCQAMHDASLVINSCISAI